MSVTRCGLQAKVLRAGGVTSAVLAGTAVASAGVVPSTSAAGLRPPTVNGTITWDVDGDGLDDFCLRNSSEISASFSARTYARFVAGYLVDDDGFAKLATGFQVGPEMLGFRFPDSYQQVAMTIASRIGHDAQRDGWAMGDTGYFGFRFAHAIGTHYGWGEVRFDPPGDGTSGYGFTILRSYYNDTPGHAIVVGDTGGGGVVPEPSVAALALLAAGGAATYRRRRRIVPA